MPPNLPRQAELEPTTPASEPPAVPPAPAAGPDELVTTRDPLVTDALTSTRSPAQLHQALARHFEARLTEEATRAVTAEKLAGERAIHLAKLTERLAVVERLTLPQIALQVLSLLATGAGGLVYASSCLAGIALLLLGGACYFVGSLLQKRALPPGRHEQP